MSKKRFKTISLAPRNDLGRKDPAVDLLYREIQDNRGIKNVGVLGPYGAGKSTIVRSFLWEWKKNHFHWRHNILFITQESLAEDLESFGYSAKGDGKPNGEYTANDTRFLFNFEG